MPEDTGYGARDTAGELRRGLERERREKLDGYILTLAEPQLPLVCLWCEADWPFHLESCPGKERE